MGKKKMVFIQPTLVPALEERAAKELTTVGRYVNELLRRDLLGKGKETLRRDLVGAPVTVKPSKGEELNEDGQVKCPYCNDGETKPNRKCLINQHNSDGDGCVICHQCEGTGVKTE